MSFEILFKVLYNDDKDIWFCIYISVLLLNILNLSRHSSSSEQCFHKLFQRCPPPITQGSPSILINAKTASRTDTPVVALKWPKSQFAVALGATRLILPDGRDDTDGLSSPWVPHQHLGWVGAGRSKGTSGYGHIIVQNDGLSRVGIANQRCSLSKGSSGIYADF